MNTNTNVSRIQKLISIFILNGYGYKSDTGSMDINMNISRIIKLYDYKIKDIIKWIVNQTNSMLIWLFFFLKIYECYIKLNKITNIIRYSDIDWIVIYPYLYPFFFYGYGYKYGY